MGRGRRRGLSEGREGAAGPGAPFLGRFSAVHAVHLGRLGSWLNSSDDGRVNVKWLSGVVGRKDLWTRNTTCRWLCGGATLPVPAQAMHGASPVPRCLVFRSRLMRHADLGARLFLLGNLFRRPPAGASPSPPPAGWLRGLRRRPQASPAACPAPALESRVWAACAGRLLWARGARYGMRSAFVSRQRSEHLATCAHRKKWAKLRN